MPQQAVQNPLAQALKMLGLNMQQHGQSVPLPEAGTGNPAYNPNTLANRFDNPSVMEPAWLTVARKATDAGGGLLDILKGTVTGGGDRPGMTAENFGAVVGAAVPALGVVSRFGRPMPYASGMGENVIDMAEGSLRAAFHRGISENLKRFGIPEEDVFRAGLDTLDPARAVEVIKGWDVMPMDIEDMGSIVSELAKYPRPALAERLGNKLANILAQRTNKQPTRWVDVGSSFSREDAISDMAGQFIKGTSINVPELSKGWKQQFIENLNELLGK